MIWFIIVTVLVVFFAWFIWNPNTKMIRDIQTLVNKDRSVCDVIEQLDGWSVSPVKSDTLAILINPVGMPMFYLYISYKGHRPSNKEIKALHEELTNYDSVVQRAHRMNMPVENYIQYMEAVKKGFKL